MVVCVRHNPSNPIVLWEPAEILISARFAGGQFERPIWSREPDNRREARYPTNDAVKVSVAPHQEWHAATILNVSRQGVQLELDRELPNRARIEILTTSVAIFGEIRYCHQTGELFHVGVLIRDVVFSRPHTEHIDDALALTKSDPPLLSKSDPQAA
jgi:PilZ domain